MTYEHKQAPFNGPGGYGVAGNPFHGVDVIPDGYYRDCVKAMKGIFTKGATGNPASRVTQHGITVSVSGGQITLLQGAMAISVQPDELEEVINDMRACMATALAAQGQQQSYNPGTGMASWPAGTGPNANDASTAGPDLQGGGGNNARTTATSSGGNTTSWLDRIRGGMMGSTFSPSNVPGV